MPEGIEYLNTWIREINLIDFSDLSPDEIIKDTETIDASFYMLPKGKLIVIKLWSDTINGGHEWATMRRYTPEKYDYYRSIIGQDVEIVIEEEKG